MTRYLRLLPGRQLAVRLAQQLLGLGLKLLDLGIDVELAGLGRVAQLADAGVELGNGFFEVEKGRHEPGGLGGFGRGVNERVAAVDEIYEASAVDVCVDLGRRDSGLTEQPLKRAPGGPAFQ